MNYKLYPTNKKLGQADWLYAPTPKDKQISSGMLDVINYKYYYKFESKIIFSW